MKPIKEMTDQELSDTLDNMRIAKTYGNAVDKDDWNGVLNEIQNRLSAHPAQRIADLTGCVVTKDEDSRFFQWHFTFTASDFVAVISSPFKERIGKWQIERVISGEEPRRLMLDITTADNRPWQESIYKPRGGKK